MPDFEMPLEPPVSPAPAPRAPVVDRALTAEPAEPGEPAAPSRARLGWRHVLIGVILGAVLGAAVPAAAQLVERGAATAEVERVRGIALDYLTAIADGRAADATRLVPLPETAQAAPVSVLQSAQRISSVAVPTVHIDGDTAAIEVRYQLPEQEVMRTLAAARTDGVWRITTTLAEPLRASAADPRLEVMIAGRVLLAGDEVLLYPARYPVGVHDGRLLRTSGAPFVVDGEPRGQDETYVEVELIPEMAAHAADLALAQAQMCQAGGSCVIPPHADLHAMSVSVDGIEREFVDVRVQLMGGREADGHVFEAQLTVLTDEEGGPTQWLCGPVGIAAPPANPCAAAP